MVTSAIWLCKRLLIERRKAIGKHPQIIHDDSSRQSITWPVPPISTVPNELYVAYLPRLSEGVRP
jgi:hypothetical protein